MAHATSIASACAELLCILSGGCAPSVAPLFINLCWGWLLCLGRPTVTNLLRSAPEALNRHWTCAHRFFSKTRWSPDELARLLACEVLDKLLPAKAVWLLAGDDTTTEKYGPKVAFAGKFRDAVRSSPGQDVFHRAHNWIVLGVLIPIPGLCARYLHLPLLARLYKREVDCAPGAFKTRQELLAEMVDLLQSWLPHRKMRLVTDGQYPSQELVERQAGKRPYLSRLRSNAVLYALPPARQPHQRGATRKKGARLPKLEALANQACFERRYVRRYGKKQLVLLHSFVCLWYRVAQSRPVRVVIVRDPSGQEPDDYFFSTDVSLSPVQIAEHCAARWGIEELIREAKQSLGFDDVQSWSPRAVERQAPLALVLHAVTQLAYLKAHHSLSAPAAPTPPPSFQRMLCALRVDKWQQRISATLPPRQNIELFIRPLAAALATAF